MVAVCGLWLKEAVVQDSNTSLTWRTASKMMICKYCIQRLSLIMADPWLRQLVAFLSTQWPRLSHGQSVCGGRWDPETGSLTNIPPMLCT